MPVDLFAAAPSEIQHNRSYVELSRKKTVSAETPTPGGTPKNFSTARLNVARAPETAKIDPENPQKNQNSKNAPKPSIRASGRPGATYPLDRGVKWNGGRSEPLGGVSSEAAEVPANVVRRTEGSEVDPKPHTAWVDRPQWHERRAPPLRRGYRNQRENVDRILAQVETPKPDVPAWDAKDAEGMVSAVESFVASGGSLSEFARRAGVSRGAVERVIRRIEGAAERVATARRTSGADALAEEALRIATEPMIVEESIETFDSKDELVTRSVKRADNVYARKLAFQARMQLLQKWCPERYGENVKPDVSDTMADRLRKARERIQGELREARRELSMPVSAG